MVEVSDEQIELLKNKGWTCSKIKARIKREMSDSKKARNDSNFYRDMGINSQSELQGKIADAEEKSANFLRSLKRRLCPLK